VSAMPGAIEEYELHARIDGRLSPERLGEVDAYLTSHPEEQARLSQYVQQQQILRAAFAEETAGPIPGRLRVARLVAEQRRRGYHRLAQAAAAMALIVIGAAGGWAVRDSTHSFFSSTNTALADARIITADAISAHRIFSVEVRHPVEVDVAQEAHLVQWLSKRLGRPLVIPDLTSAGFHLMGGRLLPAEDSPAAQFMYENGKDRLTLYVRSGIGGETAFRYSEEKGIGAFYWSDEGFGYALAAKADRNLLLRLSELIYQQTSADGAKAKIPPKSGKSS
jgi:anti-sigma factor RsiW